MDAKPKLFISRAGADEAFSTEIARVLEADGYELVLQQRDFANKNFLDEMDKALASGARVVGLLSAEYLTSKYCRAEWLNALAGDPLNENGRLILLCVTECEPVGLLSGIAYWDLLSIRDNRAIVADVVRNAVKEGDRRELTPVAGPYWRRPRTIIDPDAVRETASFTGRQAELDAVDAALWKGRGVAAIHGLGGMGKSVLAREYARRNAGRYAVVWRLQAQTENGVIEGLLRLGSRFAPELGKMQDRRAAAFEVTTIVLDHFDKPVLLVFDNLEDEGLLRNWRPRAQAHLLATSRNAAWGRDVSVIRLDSWPVLDAVSYLRHESGRDDVSLTTTDARKIADELGSLPLALSHAAAYLKRTKTVRASSYLARLQHHLKTAPTGAEYDHAVFATFREAIAKAEEEAPGACALLCMAAFFAPDAVPEELFHQKAEFAPDLSPAVGSARVVDLRAAVADSSAVDESLGALDRLSLVAFASETRTFTIHRLVQAAARTLMVSENDWVLAAIAAANEAFPWVEYDTWSICDRLLPHAVEALASWRSNEAFANVASLANKCAIYLEARAEFGDAEALARRALAIGEATYGPHHRTVATFLLNLAGILRVRNKVAGVREMYQRAIKIIETDVGPDHPELAISLNNLATFLSEHKKYAEAEPLLRRAIAIHEAQFGAEHPAVGIDLNNLAWVISETGNAVEAEQLSRRALMITEKACSANHPDIAIRLSNLAVYLIQLNKNSEAEDVIRRALKVDEASNGPDHPHVALDLVILAAILTRTGRALEAEQQLRRALSINEATYGLQHPAIKDVLERLAFLMHSAGQFPEAEALAKRARAMDEPVEGISPL